MSDFYEQVYAVVRCIPSGQVSSYGRIAQMLCQPNASRAVGYALRALYHRRDDPDYGDIPWHRVVSKEGLIRVTTLGDDAPLQVEHLRDEGVVVAHDNDMGRFQVDMKAALWEGLSILAVEALFDLDEDDQEDEDE